MLVEIFMHTFCSVDPQQLLDAPQLLEAEQRRQREEDRAAARAAAEKKRRQQQQLQQQRGGGDALPPYSSSSRQPAAGLAHLTRLPALPLQRPFVPKALMPRHVAQAAPSRHAHSGSRAAVSVAVAFWSFHFSCRRCFSACLLLLLLLCNR